LPTRQIDQPYTLPSDTKEISLGVGTSVVKSNFIRDEVTRVYPVGVLRYPISATWTWELLTGLSHQFYHDEVNTYGIQFGVKDIGYATSTGFFYAPMLSLYYKHLLSKNFALENTLGTIHRFYTQDARRDGWKHFLSIGPLFQLDDNKALSPSVTLSVEKHLYPSSYGSLEESIRPENKTVFTIPLSLSFRWRHSPGWESRVGYSYYGIGYTQRFQVHEANASLAHYW
jgi:hypothetical protein